MNKITPKLESALSDIIKNGNLISAIITLKELLKEKGLYEYDNRIEEIESSYNLMKDYMLRGYKDKMRASLYADMLRKLYIITYDLSKKLMIADGGFYSIAYNKSFMINLFEENISDKLEKYVQDLAMASLQPDDTRRATVEKLQNERQAYQADLFDAIIVSPYWNEDICSKMTATLLNPMLDVSDILTILSGISLSSTSLFDYWRFKTLYNVFVGSVDENVKQRAFVGWAFSLNTLGITFFNEAKELFAEALKNDAQINLRHQLYELQLQIIYCSDAEKDNESIQKNIMPDLLRNGNFKVTRSGIVETEEDSVDEIINSDDVDKKMEQMEEGFSKMVDMQKRGSDIYFGGFSQMKRFPFFLKVSNWFAPFDIDSPNLSVVKAKLGKMKLLDSLYKSSSFCDSDKYSFAFAIVSIIDQLPASMREMMDTAEFFGMPGGESDSQSSSYVRRRYLQDLYRFFKLNTYKNEFQNPFIDLTIENGNMLLLGKLIKYEEFPNEIMSLAKFALKQRRWNILDKLLSHFRLTDDLVRNKLDYDSLKLYYYLKGAILMHHQMYNSACKSYRSLLILDGFQRKSVSDRNLLNFDPITGFIDATDNYVDLINSNESVLKSYALSSLRNGDNSIAADCYKVLSGKKDLFKYKLYHAIALIGLDKVDEALSILFLLDMEHDDANVKRTIAWALLVKQDYEKAEKYYDKLLLSDNIVIDDYLNSGYCKWILNKNSEAVISFKNWMSAEKTVDSLVEAFNSDYNILKNAGISDIDIKLMVDIVNE
jgi:hypothetical protein